MNNFEKILIEIARMSVIEKLENKKIINKEELYKQFPHLKEKRATFVTLTKTNGELRGCIGTLNPHQSLLDDIIQNAKSAAFSDYRFTPLTKEEYDDIKFEISILSPVKEIDYKDIKDLQEKIVPFKDGIVLKYNGYKATFLPQVWEKLPDFYDFFSHLCKKAGLSDNCLSLHPKIYKYNVTKIKEE